MVRKGDIVEYVRDWIHGRKWYLLDIYGDLCQIALIRDGTYTKTRTFYGKDEDYLNANIVNLPLTEIRKLED